MTVILTAGVNADGKLAGDASTALVPWWSFTKTLIAVCTLRLAAEGRLTLDTAVPRYPFTIRHLLQHRAGLGDYGALAEYHAAVARDDEPWTDAEVFAHVAPENLLFAPGNGWAYSNVGYLLLRRIIERASGKGLNALLQDYIFAPLELRSSRLAETRADTRATVFGERSYHPGWAFHGYVIGPVAEAALTLHGIMRGDLLAPEERAALLVAHPVTGPIAGRPWLKGAYGLGVMTGLMRDSSMSAPLRVIGHSAAGQASAGAVYHAPEAGRTAAAFADSGEEGVAETAALKELTR